MSVETTRTSRSAGAEEPSASVFAPRVGVVCLLAFVAALLCSCAGQECDFNSQCGASSYCLRGSCRQDCRLDLDCEDGFACTAIGQCEASADGGPRPDAGQPDAGRDSAVPSPDAGPMDAGPMDAGPMDAGPMDAGPIDAGLIDASPPLDSGVDSGTEPDAGVVEDAGPPAATGAYLDRCGVPSDCVSGRCELDVDGAARFCSRSCAAHADCADEHICVGGVCLPDDTGTPCVTSAHSCRLFCFGNETAAHCTRECDSATDCPAGHACVNGGPTRVCADIERPGGTCVTTLFFALEGCTGDCRTASDCPSRYTALGLSPYTCAVPSAGATPVCIPPSGESAGSDPIGTACSTSASNSCRSSVCNPDAVPGPAICTQTCGAEGGCAAGLGCFAQDQGGGVFLPVCEVAGSGSLGSTCTTRNDCDSALCFVNTCTRYCADGLCPTGWTCTPSGASNIPNVCVPPAS